MERWRYGQYFGSGQGRMKSMENFAGRVFPLTSVFPRKRAC
jgi:hypothetical protein